MLMPVPLASLAIPIIAGAAVTLAVATPLLIHLLSRQRHQIVPWAAIRFLLPAELKRKRRVDRWLLLLTRIGLLLAIVFGMIASAPWAETIWQRISPGQLQAISNAPRTHRILVVDATLSMSATQQNRSRFEIAVERAEEAVNSANPGDGFTLILVTGQATAIIPGPSADATKVIEELRRLTPTHHSSDFVSTLNLVNDTISKSPKTYLRKQVLLFTDLQPASWHGLLKQEDGSIPEIWQRVLANSEFAIVDCAAATDNIAITELSLDDMLPIVDSANVVNVSVQNFSKVDRQHIRVELLIGRPSITGLGLTMLPVEQRVIESLSAGERTTLSFVIEGSSRFQIPGIHLVQARLAESDALVADDQRSLAIRVREGLSTLIVNGKLAADPLRRASEYLLEALAPAGKNSPGNPARPRGIGITEFGDPVLGDLTNVDCLVLCDVPTLSPIQVSRIETHLRRGGSLIIGLGPTSANSFDQFLPLLSGRDSNEFLVTMNGIAGENQSQGSGYRLYAEDVAFRTPPLTAFQDDNARAGLISVPFTRFVRLRLAPGFSGRTILSFVKSDASIDSPEERQPVVTIDQRFDPALIEFNRHRGKILVFTSSFNTDWTDWPVLPTYLPFVHELVRFAATTPDRHTLRVGEVLHDYLPLAMVGIDSTLTSPGGKTQSIKIQAENDTGMIRYEETNHAGLYRLQAGNQLEHYFAVNVSEHSSAKQSESNLGKLETNEFTSLGDLKVTTDPTDEAMATAGAASAMVTLAPRPHGPTIARWLISIAIMFVVAELYMAWRMGPSRGEVHVKTTIHDPGNWRRVLLTMIALVPLLLAIGVIAIITVQMATPGEANLLPLGWQQSIEQMLGIPPADVGESTRWSIEAFPAYLKSYNIEREVMLGLGFLLILGLIALYRLESRTVASYKRLVLPGLLRIALIVLLLVLVLPQLQIVFAREGWPDVVILIDDSASMSTVDDYQEPRIQQKVQELAKLGNIPEPQRIALAKALLSQENNGLLSRMLVERQVKLHIYTVADRVSLLSLVNEIDELEAIQPSISQINATGSSTQLGDGLQAVLKSFRGGSLAAIVCLTDGIVTEGNDLLTSGRYAARSGVPIYFIGIGDSSEPLDYILSDIKSDEVVLKNDKLVFEARVSAKGLTTVSQIPVVLYERDGDTLIKRDEISISPDPTGKPVTVRLSHIPKEVGERTYIIDIPVQPKEAEPSNNRAERIVLVTENRTLKVLYLEGYPRYEFRFIKALLERETGESTASRSIELNTLLLDASPGYAEQDKSALRAMPTRSELFEYDVIILGDVEPANLPKSQQVFADILDFVRERGGGLLLVGGAFSNPYKYFSTPLTELLPVNPTENRDVELSPTITRSTPGYRPTLTPLGRSHPLFRFSSDDSTNATIWTAMRPMYFAATGYQRKLTAEVLAVHPDRLAENQSNEKHPLVLQQFFGSGRVIFFGFDETWRWRTNEERFNQFWLQACRVLARNKIRRVELRTDKQVAYRKDEAIRLTVRFPEDAPSPQADAAVRVRVDHFDKKLPGIPASEPAETMIVQLTKVEGSRSTYETILTRTMVGDYRFMLTEPSVTGTTPRAEAKVLPPAGELDRVDMNQTDMQKAAAASRGKYYSILEADNLIQDLPDVSRITLNQPVPPIPLWNHAATYGLLLSLLACEWLLRRANRLL